jgi:hypothetical protein
VIGVPRLVCLARGGHRWHTTADAAGSTTTCTRCGGLRHTRVESASYGTIKAHTNLAFKWPSIPSHGSDDLDED